jgi:hypothetical protein
VVLHSYKKSVKIWTFVKLNVIQTDSVGD